MNTPQIFKTNCKVNFRKYRSREKVQIWWSKNGKIKNNEKTEELIAEYKEVEEVGCLWNVLSPSNKDRNFSLNKPYQKFDMPGQLFWKQPLRRVVENGVPKI